MNFDFTQYIVENDARGKGYRKHQFDVYVKGKGKAQETESELQSYIDNVEAKYEPYFDLFIDTKTFEEWQAVLSVKGNAG